MTKRFTFADIDACGTVRVLHGECGGVRFWAVDMPANKRDIKDALYEAVTRGETIERFGPGEEPRGASHFCKCGMKPA